MGCPAGQGGAAMRAALALLLMTPFAAFGMATGLTWTLGGPEGLAVAFATLAGLWVGVLAAGVATFLSAPRGAHTAIGGPAAELDPLPGNVHVLTAEDEYTIPAPAQLGRWGKYPAPHYDDDGTCPCPDHVAMRAGEWLP